MDIAVRDGLVQVETALPTFVSAGLDARGLAIEGVVRSSWEYLATLLEARPEIQVLVLSEADWPAKGRVPLFGLPNAGEGTLIVAGVEAGWWSDLATMPDAERRPELGPVYGRPDGALSLAAFFDLVAVHEVAHLFCEGNVVFPRFWLGEFFANLALHAWVAERDGGSMETLTVLPRLAALGSGEGFEHRSRAAFETFYTAMGGPNYVWYQFRLQVEAGALYDRAGSGAVRRLFEAFRLGDDALAARLAADVDPGLADFSLRF